MMGLLKFGIVGAAAVLASEAAVTAMASSAPSGTALGYAVKYGTPALVVALAHKFLGT